MDSQFESLIEGVLNHNYGSISPFIDEELSSALRSRFREVYDLGEMKRAGIGNREILHQNNEVRTDEIFWLEKGHHPAEQAFLERVEALMEYLNRTCYTGLNACEFHFARYAPGSFYKRHLDQFKSDKGRQFSLICYLNEHWTEDDGGQLVLYLPDQEKSILPETGRAAFFKSDEIEHEVLVANRERLSIAGWLKRV